MTEEMIDGMEAGRELDWIIAEEVMGLCLEEEGMAVSWNNDGEMVSLDGRLLINRYAVELYSTTWEGAGMVIEWLRVHYGFLEMGNSDKGWWVNLPVKHTEERTDWKILGRAETLPLALCRAALKAVLLQSPPVETL